MPLTTDPTDDCMGIVHIGSGTVTGEEFLEACKAALNLVQNTRNFHYEFIDLSAATELRLTDEHLDAVVAQDRLAATFRPNAVVVMVAPREDFFELGRRWERRIQDLGWTIRITHTRAEADKWLRENFPQGTEASKPEREPVARSSN